jgi:hypothetical protein
MLRTITALGSLFFFTACIATTDGSETRDDVASTASPVVAAFVPAFIADGATSCAPIQGTGGKWLAQKGGWAVCRAFVTRQLTGCGYSWSETGGAPADVDALASALEASVGNLVPTYGHPMPITGMCPVMNHPNPGSTPCGACQVGIATPTHVYLSLDTPYAVDTTLALRTDSQSMPGLTVHVPAHARTYAETRTLPADFSGGVALSRPSSGPGGM